MQESTPAAILVGHGSSTSGDSAAPVYRYARQLASEFDIMRVAFWKEEPYLHTAFSGLGPAVVVPMFMADGYFAGRVVPREMELADRPSVTYTAALGTLPGIIDVARDQLSGLDAKTHVLVVGHGTPRDPDSRSSAEAVAHALAASGEFGSVGAAFIDDAPTVDDAVRALPCGASIAVLPFFVADGPHTRIDLTEALGLPRYAEFGAHVVAQQTLHLLPAIGEQGLGDLLAETARAATTELEGGDDAPAGRFASLFDAPTDLGELHVAPTETGWTLHHVEGAGDERLDDVFDLHRIARKSEAGTHRPLRSTRGLRRGWVFRVDTPRALVEAVEALYPGTVDGVLEPRPRSTGEILRQQSGRYGSICSITEAKFARVVSDVCDAQCLRRRVWKAEPGSPDRPHEQWPEKSPTPMNDGSLSICCPRPCNVLLDALLTAPRETDE